MGIRVHKMIGYGLVDVKVEDDVIVDERINAKSILLDYDAIEEYEGNLTDAYFEFSKGRGGIGRSWMGDLPDDEPFQCVTWQGEFGLPNVLLVQPVGTKLWGWRRYDDAIDYIEESHHHDQENRIESFDTGLYPYVGYMRADTGEQLKQEIFTWIRARNALVSSGHSDHLDEWAIAGGFASHEEAERLVVPVVPEEIQTLVQFGDLFTGPDVWKQLRPTLYVYWG